MAHEPTGLRASEPPTWQKLLVEAAIKLIPAPGSGEDRAIAVPAGGGYLVAVADGAGGTGDGAAAADHLVAFFSRLTEKAISTDWFAALCRFDDELSASRLGGQTTGVVAFVGSDRVRGASVGDSSAWLISTTGKTTELTANQRRRPLLGTGEALPVLIDAERRGGRVLVASDGLFKYATRESICALALKGSVAEAADALAHSVRLSSGAVQDDVAVVLVSG